MKKYEITDIAHPDNPNLHRIRAVTDLTENVLAGISKRTFGVIPKPPQCADAVM